MSEWINIQDRLPTDDNPQKGPNIHCWCAIRHSNGNYMLVHLTWNPYYRVWDDDDEDDISKFNKLVKYWQPFIFPELPKE